MRIDGLKSTGRYIIDMQRTEMMARLIGTDIINVVAGSIQEFLRAVVTLFVGGLFLFYAFTTGVGTVMSFQTGEFGESLLLAMMFMLSLSVAILSVSVINGVIEK